MLSRGQSYLDAQQEVAPADLGLGQGGNAIHSTAAQPNASGQVVGASAKTDPPLATLLPASGTARMPSNRRRGLHAGASFIPRSPYRDRALA